MTRREERLEYAKSFKGQSGECEDLIINLQLAILAGATWADNTMIDKAVKWLQENFNMPNDFEQRFCKAMEE